MRDAEIRVRNTNEIEEVESSLVDREELLQKAQAISRIGYWKYTPSTGEVVGSDELFRIFGLDTDEANIDAFVSVVHPDDVELVVKAFQECIEKAERWDFKYRLACRDGAEKWVHAIGEAVTDDSGNVIHLLGTAQDVTDNKATEMALRESELWMKSIFNSLDEAVLVVSPEREFINVNKAAEVIFGYSYDEISNSSTELFHVDRQHYLEFGKRINEFFSKGQTAKFEFESKRKSGEIFPTEHTVSLLKDQDGNIKGIVSVVKDITERKVVEQNLLKSEARLNEAQRMAKVGVWELDLLTNELTWSDEVFRIFDIDKETFPPSYEVFLEFIYPEDREVVDKAYSDSLTNKEPYEIEHRIVLCDGKIKHVHEKCETFFDSNGKAIRLVGTVHDITERKQAEEALVESEARYRRAEEGTNDGLWEWNIVTGDDYFSPRWLAMLGYEPGELPYHVDTFIDLIHPDDLAIVKAAMENHLQNNTPYNIEMRLRHKNGSYIWVQTRGQVERDKEGSPTIMTGFITNIAKRKKAEEELARVQAMLKQANRISRMGAWSYDLQSNELEWSDVTKEIHEVDLDYKPNIETGINFYKAGVDRDTISHAVRDAIENGVSWDEELVIVTAKGNEKWVRAMGRAEFKDGVCVRLNGSFQDITQRKQAEQEFERMLELSPDLIGVGNLEGYFTRINSSFERLLGYSENELLAKPFFDFVLEDDLQSTIAEMNNAINGKNDIFIANRCKCKDGSVKWIEWDVLALNEENKFYTTGRDVTDRKVYEEELEKYRFKLEDMVAERTQELVKSLAEKEVLLKEVHHRVKNNMAMVSAFIRLQMGRAENISSLNALKACENRIQAMSMVHKSLYQSNDFTSINMQLLFEEIGNALCTESGYENIELEVQAGDVSLEMDSAIPCAMIVNELLTNSLKYAFADGQPGKVNINMHIINDSIFNLRVSDTGPGLPEDVSINDTDTLGLQLLNVFVGQLNGDMKIIRNGGSVCEVIFPNKGKR